jgi:hypothetical protein
MASNNWDDIAKRLAEQEALQNKVNNSAAEYLKLVKEIGLLQENLNKLKKQQTELDDKATAAEQDRIDAENDLAAARQTGIAADIDAAKQKFKEAKKAEKAAKGLAKYNEKQTKQLEEQLKTQKKIVQEANKANIAYVEAGKIWNKLPGLAQSFYGKIKNLAAVQMSKDIKAAELSMGILNGQSKFFSKTISTASESTIQLGVGVSDLAKGQADYSAEIGRSVMLSEAGYEAMAQMAKGTTLGMQGAAQMAGDMERFGLSVESSRDAIQKTVDIAHSMGVNAEKAIKGLGKNLKIANTYHFKGGVKGMAEMAVYAEKMKVDMGSIAGMAGKVFRPEGAVEMAAQLQTMGGSFARLGNPFELMFKARNDFGAFTKDVAAATAELAQFNEGTGEFEISGLQLDRLREIAKITGIGEEQLSEMAKAGAKFNQVKSLIPSTFEPEDKELISSLAQMGEDGQWRVRMDGENKLLSELDANALQRYKDEKESLDARAQQAQTFDDAFNNLVNQFKTVMLPFVESLNSYFVPALRDFQKKLIDENWIGKMKEIAEDVGNFIVGVGKVTNAIIDTLGIGGTLATILGGTVFFNAAKWYAQGVQLGLGFNTVASKGGMGSMLDNLPGGKKMRVGTKLLKAGGPRMAQGAKLVGSGMGRLAAPLAGIAAAFSEYNEQKDKGDSTEKAALKAGVKGLGTAGGALLGAKGGAMAGASIGALFGGVGAVPGAFIGGLIGSIGGAMAGGFLTDSDTYGVDDAIIKFNPQDKIVSMDDGLVASTSKGKIDELFQGRGIKKQKIKFGKLEIGGKITLEMPGGNVANIDLTREPEFVRKLSTMIQEQLRTNLAGGKLSPNPIPRYDN